MQAARVDVVPLLELPARVQRGEDHLDGRLLVLRHRVDRDAAAVVLDGDGPRVLVQRDHDARGEPVDHLVDGVVDDFPQEVMVAGRVGAADVHGRALADGLEALQHLDVLRRVRGLPRSHYALASGFCSGNGTNWMDLATLFTVSFFAISRPFPPRDATSYLRGLKSSLRPFSVSISSFASLSEVQRKATTGSSPPV